jgi:hypothetical protein
MTTRSGLEYLLTINTHNDTTSNHRTMSDSDDAAESMTRTVLVTYAVGEIQHIERLLSDIYDADNQLVEHNAYDLIMGPMALLTKQMMNGKNNAKYIALEEAIKRRDADIYLRGSDRIDIAVGRSQSELQASARQLTIATLTSTSIQIVVKMHGFKANRGTDESSDVD